MSKKIHACEGQGPYVPECSECADLEYKIEKAQKCCDDAHEQIDDLDETKADEAELERSVQALNGKIEQNQNEIERIESRVDNLVLNSNETRETLWTGQASGVDDTILLSIPPETVSLSVSAGSTGTFSLAHTPKNGSTIKVTFYCLDYSQVASHKWEHWFTGGTSETVSARSGSSLTVGNYQITYDGTQTFTIDGSGVSSSYRPLEVQQAAYDYGFDFLDIYYRSGIYSDKYVRVPWSAISSKIDLEASMHAAVSADNPNYLNFMTTLRRDSDTQFTITVAEEYIIENATGLTAEILDVAGITVTRVDGISKSSSSNTNAEVIDARTGADGTVYPTLKDRLDSENDDLKAADAELKEAFDALGLSVVDGAINVTYTV